MDFGRHFQESDQREAILKYEHIKNGLDGMIRCIHTQDVQTAYMYQQVVLNALERLNELAVNKQDLDEFNQIINEMSTAQHLELRDLVVGK